MHVPDEIRILQGRGGEKPGVPEHEGQRYGRGRRDGRGWAGWNVTMITPHAIEADVPLHLNTTLGTSPTAFWDIQNRTTELAIPDGSHRRRYADR